MRRQEFSTPSRFTPYASPSVGGANRDRTGDLLLAKQALSQLSYSPVRDQESELRDQSKRFLIPDP